MMRSSLLSLLALTACGGTDAGSMHVALRVHQAINCDNGIAGLQAELQVAGRTGNCPLDVAEDRSISGFCPAIPTGRPVQIRLAYFIDLDPDTRVTLAVANQDIDLTTPSDTVVVVSFPDSAVMYSDLDQFDDDTDRISNLEEVCNGTDPRVHN